MAKNDKVQFKNNKFISTNRLCIQRFPFFVNLVYKYINKQESSIFSIFCRFSEKINFLCLIFY